MIFRQERKTVMDHQQNCQNCAHEDSCKELYRRMGHQDAPSVTGKIMLAFALPLFIFVTCLAVIQQFLGAGHPKLTTLIGFVVSLAVTLLVVCLTKRMVRT